MLQALQAGATSLSATGAHGQSLAGNGYKYMRSQVE
jgi:hypothetical protein